MGMLAIVFFVFFLMQLSPDHDLNIVLSQVTKLKKTQGHISQDKELIYHKKTTL